MWEKILKSLTLTSIIVLISLSIASIIIPSSEDFDERNTFWNGLQKMYEYTNAISIDFEIQKIIPEGTVLLIIGPSKNISEIRIEAWKKYVEDGGILILMDEIGNINPILSKMQLNIEIDGHFMLDGLFYHWNWKMPKITNIIESELTLNVNEIILNLPSIIKIKNLDSKIKVIAYSSSFSFLDLNRDGIYTDGEPMGPFIVIVEIDYGKGKIIVFSDSSIFINNMIDLSGNKKLLENIVRDKRVFIDIGVWQLTPQQNFRNTVIWVYNIISTIEFRYVFIILTITLIYITINNRRKIEVKYELEELLKKHKNWDRNLLKILKEERDRIGK